MYVPEKASLVVIGEPPGWQQAAHGFCMEDFLSDDLYYTGTEKEIFKVRGEPHYHVEVCPRYALAAYRTLLDRLLCYLSKGDVIYFFCKSSGEAEQFMAQMRHEGVDDMEIVGRIVAAIKGTVTLLERVE